MWSVQWRESDHQSGADGSYWRSSAETREYSFTLERGLIQALRMGEADEAYRLLEEFAGRRYVRDEVRRR